MPSPLHPAVVHFPVVFILVGALLAILALALRRHPALGLAAATLLLGGALFSTVASITGEQDEHAAGAAAKALLEEHEHWALATQAAAWAAAALALAGAVIGKTRPRFGRIAAVLAAVAALGGAVCVSMAGHLGGRLVYEYGAGVRNAPAAPAPSPSTTPPSAPL